MERYLSEILDQSNSTICSSEKEISVGFLLIVALVKRKQLSSFVSVMKIILKSHGQPKNIQNTKEIKDSLSYH